MNNRNLKSSNERLAYQTNQQISCCQTTIQEFGRWMDGRYLVKCNEDQRIPKKCCKGKKNVDCWQKQGVLLQFTRQRRGAYKFFKRFRLRFISSGLCCRHPLQPFYLFSFRLFVIVTRDSFSWKHLSNSDHCLSFTTVCGAKKGEIWSMNSPYASGIKDHKDICYHHIL